MASGSTWFGVTWFFLEGKCPICLFVASMRGLERTQQTRMFVTKHAPPRLITHWQIVKPWPCTIVSRPREIQEISLCKWNHETQRLRRNSLIINVLPLLLFEWGLLATDGLHLGFGVNRISPVQFPYSCWLKMPPADTCDYPAATWHWNTISIMVAKLCGQIIGNLFFFICLCHKFKWNSTQKI